MFKKLSILLTYLCFYATAQISAQDTTKINWEDFYPLHVGDFWKYVIEWTLLPIVEIESKEVVAETTMSNYRTYKKLLYYNHTFGHHRYEYERVDSLGDVYGYRNDDVLLWKLGIEVGDTWNRYDDNEGDYWQLKEKFLIPFWGSDSVLFLSYRFYVYAYDEVWWDSIDCDIVQNFGFVGSSGGGCGGAPTNLVGAVIKGKAWGDTTVTHVKEKNYILHKNLIFYPNYPNPFNTSTNIIYELNKGGDVMLQIINLKGEIVKTLIDEHQKGGVYQVIWNGDSEMGDYVASGLYFSRLRVGNQIRVRKLTLIK